MKMILINTTSIKAIAKSSKCTLFFFQNRHTPCFSSSTSQSQGSICMFVLVNVPGTGNYICETAKHMGKSGYNWTKQHTSTDQNNITECVLVITDRYYKQMLAQTLSWCQYRFFHFTRCVLFHFSNIKLSLCVLSATLFLKLFGP